MDENSINDEDQDPFEKYLPAAVFSIRCSYHQTQGHSPAQLVFDRDMFMSVDTEIDCEKIRQPKQLNIQQSNILENCKRIVHIYGKGDMITLKNPGAILHTLALSRQGPYKVLKHHANGSIKIEMEPNVVDRVNIRRCYPYYLMLDTIDENGPDENTHQAMDKT